MILTQTRSRGRWGWCSAAILGALLGLSPAQADSPRASVKSTIVLKVTDREHAADALVQKTIALEGYFAVRTDDALVLKVPIGEADKLIELAQTLGVVADRRYETQDLGFELEQLRARLASREALLSKYFAVLEEAGPTAVVSVEREITGLVAEVETLKGSLRMLEHRLQLAEVSISFRFRDRSAPKSDGASNFPWLNTMNLIDLEEDFRRGHK